MFRINPLTEAIFDGMAHNLHGLHFAGDIKAADDMAASVYREERAQRGKVSVADSLCPKCGRQMLDLRHIGCNHKAVEAEGVCFQWSDDEFTCSNRQNLTPTQLAAGNAYLRERLKAMRS